MGRLLVVGRNPTLALALARGGHDVLEVRPARLGAYASDPDRIDPDALVIDRPEADEATAALATVRAAGIGAPALLLVPTEWELPDLGEATRTLALPVGGAELVKAIDVLLAAGEVSAEPLAPVAPAAPAALASSSGGAGQGEPATGPAVTGPAVAGPAEPEDGVDGGRVVDLRPEPQPVPVPVPERPPGPDTAQLRAAVATVLLGVEEVYGVRESAAVVLTEARGRVRADRAAILVPDQDRWRTAAGEDLRPGTPAETLTSSSWLVATLGGARRGLVLEDTPLVRERMAGAPLGQDRRVLVAPVSPGLAILVLARDEGPDFDEADVEALVDLGGEAGAVLAAALDARSLARALAPLRDVEPLVDLGTEPVPGSNP